MSKIGQKFQEERFSFDFTDGVAAEAIEAFFSLGPGQPCGRVASISETSGMVSVEIGSRSFTSGVGDAQIGSK